MRTENDLLGELNIPDEALWGIHTARSLSNFQLSDRRIHPSLIHAMGDVKMACAKQSIELGQWKNEPEKAKAILLAASEIAQGRCDTDIVVDPLQGGAGTSLNMNVNEVIANRAIQILGGNPGEYDRVSPLDDINLHQSTNDVFPTALRISLLRELDGVIDALGALLVTLEKQAEAMKDIVKVGRTQFQDAVLTTLGLEMSAYAEAIKRNIQRLNKSKAELYSVNLGGTAIGTCVGAPQDYVRGVVQKLAQITHLPLVQAEDLIDGTQNQDAFANLSGALKTLAASLIKIATDLRFMSSGPQAGIAEIKLPPRQAGSSIMPGKVNPVIPEALVQIGMIVIGHDVTVSMAVSNGCLELNPFLPLVADCMLNDMTLMARGLRMFNACCMEGITPNRANCERGVHSSTALITAMVPRIGYDRACSLGRQAARENKSIRDKLIEENLITKTEAEKMLDANAVRATMADKKRT